ncbi:MAG: hypothetical protein AAGB24_12380 [Bacteroidota bacterium]
MFPKVSVSLDFFVSFFIKKKRKKALANILCTFKSMDFWLIGERILTISGLIGLVITVYSFIKKNQIFFMLHDFFKKVIVLKINRFIAVLKNLLLKKTLLEHKSTIFKGFFDKYFLSKTLQSFVHRILVFLEQPVLTVSKSTIKKENGIVTFKEESVTHLSLYLRK